MDIKLGNQSIILREYLIKGISHPKIPDTRFFFIAKYPPLDTSDLLKIIFNSDKDTCRSTEFIDHIIWALRFSNIYPPEISAKFNITKNDNYINNFLMRSNEVVGKNEMESFFYHKYVPIYYWGFSFIWKNSNESTRENALKHFERSWNKDDFDDVKLWSYFIYEMVLNRINKYIYKQIHNQINREERRLFLLYYTKMSFIGYRILYQESILKGFLKLPEVAKLCYLYFIHRINKIHEENIPRFLNIYFRSYLSFCENFLNKQEQSILLEHLNGSSQAEIANKHQLSKQLVSKRIRTTMDKIREQTLLENKQLNDIENNINSYPPKEFAHLLENLTGALNSASLTDFGSPA